MPFTISDNTAGVQRFAVDNSQHTELGDATPSVELSVNGNSILNGALLAQKVAAPASMPRTLGVNSISAGTVVTISLPTSAGFASISGPGTVVRFNSAMNQITVLGNGYTSDTSVSYGSF